MRQVPASSSMRTPASDSSAAVARYLVVGGGRLARHLVHYLQLENLPVSQVSSRENVMLGDATHVLLAVSDSAIATVAQRLRLLIASRAIGSLARDVNLIHFSGSVVIDGVPSAHPLMTFGHELYTLDRYRAIPFITELGQPPIETLMPGLQNESFPLDPIKKPLYHALCSMSGNFTVLLWEKVFSAFSAELSLPRDVLFPFLAQTCANLISSNGESVLTGPLARGDFSTIEKHLTALRDDPFADVYRAFVRAYSASHAQPVPFPLGGLV